MKQHTFHHHRHQFHHLREVGVHVHCQQCLLNKEIQELRGKITDYVSLFYLHVRALTAYLIRSNELSIGENILNVQYNIWLLS